MLHPKKIFYFSYASAVDPHTLAGENISFLSVMRAALPSYTCIKSRLGCDILRKHAQSHVKGNVYAFTKEAFSQFEQYLEGFERRIVYVMMLDTNLLQEVVLYKPIQKRL